MYFYDDKGMFLQVAQIEDIHNIQREIQERFPAKSFDLSLGSKGVGGQSGPPFT
jgi:hypothetical protein